MGWKIKKPKIKLPKPPKVKIPNPVDVANEAAKAAKKAAEKAREERMEALATAAGIGMAVIIIGLSIYYLGIYLDRW